MLAAKKPMLTCPMERQPTSACAVFMKTRYKSTKLLQQAGDKLSTAYCQTLGEEEGSGGKKSERETAMKAGENSVPSRHGSRSWATGYDEEYLRESAQPVHRPRPQKCPPRSSARPFSPLPSLSCDVTQQPESWQSKLWSKPPLFASHRSMRGRRKTGKKME
jgi:hypothetical protein